MFIRHQCRVNNYCKFSFFLSWRHLQGGAFERLKAPTTDKSKSEREKHYIIFYLSVGSVTKAKILYHTQRPLLCKFHIATSRLN